MIYDPALSNFDIDQARGTQGELFVRDIKRMLADGNGSIEVKYDAWYPLKKRFYVEYECWSKIYRQYRPSGIMNTRSKLWGFVYGKHPGMMIIETAWLRRAFVLARMDKRNWISMSYGGNPTRGILVFENHIVSTRDIAFDEHELDKKQR